MNKLLFILLTLILPRLEAAPISNAALAKLAADAQNFGFPVPENPVSAPVPAFKAAEAPRTPRDEHPWVIYEKDLLRRPLTLEDYEICVERVDKFGGDKITEFKKCTITRNYLLDINARGDKDRSPFNADLRYCVSRTEVELLWAKFRLARCIKSRNCEDPRENMPGQP